MKNLYEKQEIDLRLRPHNIFSKNREYTDFKTLFLIICRCFGQVIVINCSKPKPVKSVLE